MTGGYAGKDLWVDLSSGRITEETPDDKLRRDFIGGYGMGARLLFSRQRALIDPLGPEAIFGITTGPLTGSPAPAGTRWTVVGKSPLTGGWGDANGSGFAAPVLKQAGYDAVYFTGIAPEPVYLTILDGKAELHSAKELWGKDTYYIEDWAKAEYGKSTESFCIGPSSEKLSLISGVVTRRGRVAGRSGLGAVMGSKKLKAVVVRGERPVPVADPARANELRKKHIAEITAGTNFASFYSGTGTPGYTPMGAVNGDSPTKNWSVSTDHFPSAKPLEFEELLKYRVKREACWHCPIACWGTSKLTYAGREVEAHQPEYETAAAFGTMALNNNYPSLIVVNDICNRYGLDTISAGGAVAFAIECFENGLITEKDTGGIRLRWGDPDAIVAMTEKLALRQDFGDVIADGVKRAAEKVGPQSEPFAIHCAGQELPMHDPRFEPAMGVIYALDATPGRHTQACQYNLPFGYATTKPTFGVDPKNQAGRGKYVRECSILMHTVNASGMCLFGYLSTTYTFIPDFISAVTGWDYTVQDMELCGEKIGNIRQAFTVREGVNLVQQKLPLRAFGRPPLPDGPTAGVYVDVEKMGAEYLSAMGWTLDSAAPTAQKLRELGLDDVAAALWP